MVRRYSLSKSMPHVLTGQIAGYSPSLNLAVDTAVQTGLQAVVAAGSGTQAPTQVRYIHS